MKFPQKWMDHWFLRGIAGLLGFRNPYNADVYATFTPYFQYRIGPYQTDHHLYFIAEPRKWEYISEIFQKMYEYRGYDLIRYIDFHYQAYGDKADFLRFLRHEASREQRELRKYRYCFWVRLPIFKERLRATLAWVEEEESRLRELPVESAAAGPKDDLGAGEGLLNKIEDRFTMLMHTHLGKIVLNNQHHILRLIQVFILLRDVAGGNHELLFKSFSDTDMTALLRQFEIFGDKKTNTLQVKIGDAKKELDLNDPAAKSLSKALTEFFFRAPITSSKSKLPNQ